MNLKYKIRARFIGRHGSMGYLKGQYYDLTVIKYYNPKKNFIQILFAGLLEWSFKHSHYGGILYIENPYYCPYDSWNSFKENWKITSKESI